MAPNNKKNTNKKASKWATKESGKTDAECLDDCTKIALGEYKSTAEMKAEQKKVSKTLADWFEKKLAYDTTKSMLPGLSEKQLKTLCGDMEGIDDKIEEAQKKLVELTFHLAVLEQLEAAKNNKDDKDGEGGSGGSNGGGIGGGLAV